MVAASTFYNLNKITKAEFDYFSVHLQTTKQPESNIVFVQYQFSKRFLVWCKIICLKLL